MVLAQTLPSTSAFAAEFVWDEDPVTRCAVEMSGTIEAGDAAKLEALLGTNDRYATGGPFFPWSPNAADKRICLDSAGGSFAEGLAIAKVLADHNFGTLVGPNAECLSACSLVFFAGNYFNEGEALLPDRVLHPTATLGVHAPSLPLTQTGFLDWEMVSFAYGAALQTMSDIQENVDLLRIDSELLSKILTTPPDQFFYIDTVGKVIRWQIGLYDHQVPGSIGTYELQTACDAALVIGHSGKQDLGGNFGDDLNYGIRELRAPPEFESYGHISLTQSESATHVTYEGRRSGYLGEATSDCLFDYRIATSETGIPREISSGSVQFTGYDAHIRILPHMVFSPDTKLIELTTVTAGSIERVTLGLDAVDSGIHSVRGMCRVISGRAGIIDAEVCVQTMEGSATIHTWPSGARTVLQLADGRPRINGAPARFVQDGTSGSNTYLGRCDLNTRTGNTFCFYSYVNGETNSPVED